MFSICVDNLSFYVYYIVFEIFVILMRFSSSYSHFFHQHIIFLCLLHKIFVILMGFSLSYKSVCIAVFMKMLIFPTLPSRWWKYQKHNLFFCLSFRKQINSNLKICTIDVSSYIKSTLRLSSFILIFFSLIL